MQRTKVLLCLSLSLSACSQSKRPLPLDAPVAQGHARAGRITKTSELIGGLNAKATLGDYKLYNDKIAVIVAQADVPRGFNLFGGDVLDADIIRPAGEGGHSRYGQVINSLFQEVMHPDQITVTNDGQNGGPAIVHMHGHEDVIPLFDSILSGLFTSVPTDIDIEVDYILPPDSNVLEIKTTLFNPARTSADIGQPLAAFIFGNAAPPALASFGFQPPTAGGAFDFFAAVDEQVGYAYGELGHPIGLIFGQQAILVSSIGDPVTLRAHEHQTYSHHLVVGPGDLSQIQAAWRTLAGNPASGKLSGTVRSSSGAPIEGARVHITRSDAPNADQAYVSRTKTAADGSFSLALDPGHYDVTVIADDHAPADPRHVEVSADQPSATLTVSLDDPGKLTYRITDPQGVLLPAKITVRSSSASTHKISPSFGEANTVAGTIRTEYAVAGQGAINLPAGRYTIDVTRGGEYEIVERSVTIAAGQPSDLTATLVRSVNTDGWISTDTHIHTRGSFDSPDPLPFKVQTMVVEGLEMPISTDHDFINDFNPAIQSLGLSKWIQGVVGTEITTFTYGHFNAWPLIADPGAFNNGRIDWYKKTPAQLFGSVRALPGDPYLQVNHPRSQWITGYFETMGLDPTTFKVAADDYSNAFDGIEVANGCWLGQIQQVMTDWFAFLNHGQAKWAAAGTDSHTAGFGEMGYPKTYVRVPNDDPAAATPEDMRRAMKAGHMMVSCGPFIELTSGQASMGDVAEANGDLITLSARVAAPSWMDVQRLKVIVNGKVVKTVALPQAQGTGADRFVGTLTASISAGRDAWAIVVVEGDTPMDVYASGLKPYAFTNPILIDGDGDHMWTQTP
jgi:hypothetical protein